MQVKNFSGQVILAKIFQKPHPTFLLFLNYLPLEKSHITSSE